MYHIVYSGSGKKQMCANMHIDITPQQLWLTPKIQHNYMVKVETESGEESADEF